MNKNFWERIDRLEKLAGNAEGDKWTFQVGRGWDICAGNFCVAQVDGKNNAEYIASANPAMILAMIDVLKKLFLDNSTLHMDLHVARRHAQKMSRNNMKLHKRLTNLQKKLNDVKSCL